MFNVRHCSDKPDRVATRFQPSGAARLRLPNGHRQPVCGHLVHRQFFCHHAFVARGRGACCQVQTRFPCAREEPAADLPWRNFCKSTHNNIPALLMTFSHACHCLFTFLRLRSEKVIQFVREEPAEHHRTIQQLLDVLLLRRIVFVYSLCFVLSLPSNCSTTFEFLFSLAQAMCF